MRRTCFVLLALVLTLFPAVWARRMAEYPGWAGEIALRGAGCDSISTRLAGWTALPETTDAAGAAGVAEQLIRALGFSGQPVTTPEFVLISDTRAGAAVAVQANLRDQRWLLTAEVTCSANAAGWYRLLGDALNMAGYAGRTHVSVLGLKAGRMAPVAAALAVRTLCRSMLATVVNTVADGDGGRVVSGSAGLIPSQPGTGRQGGSFALSLNFSDTEQATIITVSVPGLR